MPSPSGHGAINEDRPERYEDQKSGRSGAVYNSTADDGRPIFGARQSVCVAQSGIVGISEEGRDKNARERGKHALVQNE